MISARTSIRTRLTVWYVTVLGILLIVYAAIVFVFQYATLTNQIFHDEVQDVETVEGLLYFDPRGTLQLRQDYYSRPQSHLLVDRMMEVRDLSGNTIYRSSTLHGLPLGGPIKANEGDNTFNEHITKLDDGRHVFVISHLHGMEGRVLLIRLGYSLVPLRDRMVQFLLLLLIALPVALALAALAGQAIATRALRPLEEMTARAEGISANNLNDRLVIATPDDELGHLALVFNHLLQRLEAAFQQLQRFTADAAHELRTPLAALRAIGEVAIESDGSAQAYREALSSILEETGRLNGTVDSLLLLARAEAVHPVSATEVFSIGPLISEVLSLLSVLTEEREMNVQFNDDGLGRTSIRADRGLLRVAIVNVLHNAVKFSPERGLLIVSLASLSTQPSVLRLTVEDQGPGLTEEDQKRAFERFFRGTGGRDSAHGGAGLGLAITQLVVERIGGRVFFEEAVSLGARCVLELPAEAIALP